MAARPGRRLTGPPRGDDRVKLRPHQIVVGAQQSEELVIDAAAVHAVGLPQLGHRLAPQVTR